MTRSTYLFSAACGFWSVHAALTRWIGRPMTLGVLLTVTFLVGAGSNRLQAADKIGVIVADQAPVLEKQAATELAQSLKKIYSAEVVVSDSPPIMATHLILVGTPSSNPLISRLNLTWPKVEPELASQSVVMKSVTISGLPTLILAGGSSSATYWAVWEFLQELGVRPMLFGDLLPIQPKPIPWQRPESIWTPKIASRG